MLLTILTGNRHFTKDTSPSSSSSDCCVVPRKAWIRKRRTADQRISAQLNITRCHRATGTGTLLDKTDIEQVLKNEAARAPFQQFLQQQFCAENINFYLAVEEYRCIPESEPDRRTDFGRQIFDRHFASNCIEPVNIDNSTANSIRDAYKKNKFGPELYDVVQYQIFHLLKYDCWPRYLRAGGQCSEDLGGDGSGRAHADSIASTSGKYSGTGAANEFCVGEKRSVENRFFVDEMDNPHSDLPKKTKHEESCSIVDYAPSSSCCSSSQKSLETREFSQNHDSDVENNRRISNSSSDCPEVDQCSMKKAFRNKNFGEIGPGAGKSSREPQADFPLRTCTLLCADVASEISLFDQLQSVKQWAASIAETHGLDKNATEVVDAQTGSTIDPARQAVDALNNRTVRIMPVVKFPVVFLASSSASKPSPPIPAKVIILRARVALTVGKTIRPIMSKYNVDPDQAIVCISGTCEMVKLSTPINSIYQKSLTVMSEQQFSERKSIPKKEYQKELVLQYATRSNSSNPREFFKFGRKPSQAKATRGGIGGEAETLNVGSPNETSSAFSSHLRNPNFGRGSDRRKSPNSHQATSSGHSTGAALAVGLVAPADIPYCGENEPDTASDANYPSSTISAIPSSFTSGSSFDKARQSLCYELPDFLKQNDNIPSSTAQIRSVGSNGSMPCVPAIYASAVRSIDKDSAMTPTDDAMDSGLTWQKADYV
uniref:RGS domain-containing protein n=1 Tax=Ditylenchus dipsaci TaxID=166011 RepID=A0A915CWQ1_9BILA